MALLGINRIRYNQKIFYVFYKTVLSTIYKKPKAIEFKGFVLTIPSPKITRNSHEFYRVLRPEKVGHLLKTPLHLS